MQEVSGNQHVSDYFLTLFLAVLLYAIPGDIIEGRIAIQKKIHMPLR
jgi:hypothetical protein